MPYYVLHVDGIGEYGARSEKGDRCLFIFTSRKAVSDFVELMELPEHKHFTAVSFDAGSLVELLVGARPIVRQVAIDPATKFEFAPVQLDDFLDRLRDE